MGTLNIEWININAQGAMVTGVGQVSLLDLTPIDFTDTSFEVMTTTTTSSDSTVAPATATHALVHSVSGLHYIRLTTAPSVSSGGICISSGGSRIIPCTAGTVLRVVSTA